MNMHTATHPSKAPRAFTLTELMIAVVVLLIVIIAAGKIFDTVTKVTGLSEATTSVLQEAAAIERQLRQDFETLAPEGFFAIRQIRIRNDFNGLGNLLDPSLSPFHYFRADQLVYFVNSRSNIQTYRQAAGSNHKAEGTVAFVYFGPGFQLLNGLPVQAAAGGAVTAHDPLNDVFPWTTGAIDMVRTTFRTGGTTDNFNTAAAGTIDGTQPPPNQWLLVRQQAMLVNDSSAIANPNPNDNGYTVYLGDNITARSIFLNDPFLLPRGSRELRNGRVDAAATLMNNVRNRVEFNGGTALDWTGSTPSQRTRIADTMQYRRAEREAPSMHRVDQALTNAVIGTGCSSVRIEWTYEPGVGFADRDGIPNNGNEFRGFSLFPTAEQPWFGLPDDGNDSHGVQYFGSFGPPQTIQTIFPDNIEGFPNGAPASGDRLQVYEAFFGYNQAQPLGDTGSPNVDHAYTPWPTAVRITLTLHDANTRIQNGREVQFVVRLPKRVGQ